MARRSSPSPYGQAYRRQRARLLAQGLPCSLRLVCTGAPANSADHDPPLAEHAHLAGSGCCVLRPACLPCQKTQGKLVARDKRLGLGAWARKSPQPTRAW
jgi:hypothetical protein